MENVVIGADGGGTKTEVILVKENGLIINKLVGGSTNFQAIGGEKLKSEILSLIDKLLKKSGVNETGISQIFLGLAGAGRKSDQEAITKLFNDTVYKNMVRIDTDAKIALAGAFGNRPGIILIAGTGAICFGMDESKTVIRSGGWGYLLGDEGSGYYMGREAIIAALKDFDGRGEHTSLRKILETKFNLNTVDMIIPMIYQNKIDRITIANLTPVVFEEAKKGDVIASQIVKTTGKELGKLVKAVCQRMKLASSNIQVALIGSLFKQREILIDSISEELQGNSYTFDFIDPEFSPSIGAAILALELCGVRIDQEILSNLRQTAGVVI